MEDTPETPADNPKTTPKLTKTQINALVRRAKRGDERAFETLLKVLDSQHAGIASHYWIPGSDRQDVLQECRLSAWAAVQSFNPEKTEGMSFMNFALMAATRHIQSVLTQARRLKYKNLNDALYLDEDPQRDDFEDVSITPNPNLFSEERLANEEKLDAWVVSDDFGRLCDALMPKLSRIEKRVFEKMISGHRDWSYAEMQADLKLRGTKSVDNALLRIKNKARGMMDENAQVAGVKTG